MNTARCTAIMTISPMAAPRIYADASYGHTETTATLRDVGVNSVTLNRKTMYGTFTSAEHVKAVFPNLYPYLSTPELCPTKNLYTTCIDIDVDDTIMELLYWQEIVCNDRAAVLARNCFKSFNTQSLWRKIIAVVKAHKNGSNLY